MTPQEQLSAESLLWSPYGVAFVFGYFTGQVACLMSGGLWRDFWRAWRRP